MSTIKLKMTEIKEAFFESMDFLAAKSTFADPIGVNNFYESAYDFSRLSNLYFDSLHFTKEDTEIFVQHFPTAASSALHSTTSLYQNSHQNSVNWLKHWRSNIAFVKNDLCELFLKFSSDSFELIDVINGFEHEDTFIQEILENREGGKGLLNNDEFEIPNLNGVPESHNWWSDHDRSIWKDKDAFIGSVIYEKTVTF